MSVGVAEGATKVNGTAVPVGGGDVCVAVGGEEGIGVKTSTEKLQASSNSELNTKAIIGRYHFRCFIAFSLSALANNIGSDEVSSPNGIRR